VPDVNRETLQTAILRGVSKKSIIYTDEHKGYAGLKAQEYIHEAVNHTREYVRGEVHTNGIENFWSLLKRTLRGTYVAVEPFHLDRYLDEQVFRFNNRATKDNKLNDSDRFALAMSQVAGKRLTYAELTGKGTDAVCHPEAGTGQEEPF
jgi:transposase-like protein